MVPTSARRAISTPHAYTAGVSEEPKVGSCCCLCPWSASNPRLAAWPDPCRSACLTCRHLTFTQASDPAGSLARHPGPPPQRALRASLPGGCRAPHAAGAGGCAPLGAAAGPRRCLQGADCGCTGCSGRPPARLGLGRSQVLCAAIWRGPAGGAALPGVRQPHCWQRWGGRKARHGRRGCAGHFRCVLAVAWASICLFPVRLKQAWCSCGTWLRLRCSQCIATQSSCLRPSKWLAESRFAFRVCGSEADMCKCKSELFFDLSLLCLRLASGTTTGPLPAPDTLQIAASGARLLAFLSGPPNCGRGSVLRLGAQRPARSVGIADSVMSKFSAQRLQPGPNEAIHQEYSLDTGLEGASQVGSSL